MDAMKPNEKSIELSELKALTNRLFESLEHAGVDRIPVTQNQYWTVFVSEAFGSAEPPQATMSDVLDDLADLRSEVTDEDQETTLIAWHAFEHLSGLMKFVAHADLDGSLTAPLANSGVPRP
ncbi:hypothetical protein G6N74_06255 [Mesorhizobium sp. CGMCC 1.15528]|uniref:Uncharacterized protein n=1 Tax=Mesorhizobium zhangyense TaxID=1776730 RepID=A0A7C9R5I1_9HYPH|nr:hypothetical protein [Mesorhizobium zhangyense]NGN40661.1 hypothetical protein [Mesorhizobium zhangyense]